MLLLYLHRIGSLHTPLLPCKADLWPGWCSWLYRRGSCVGYGSDGKGMVRVGWKMRDGWRSATSLSQTTHSICCTKQGFARSSNTSLLSKSTSKRFPWKCCLFAAKTVNYWRPSPTSFGYSQNNSSCCTRCTEILIAHFCTVTMWGVFLLRVKLIFKKSYSSSWNQSNKAYLEKEVLCCPSLLLALKNWARKEIASLILLPLAHSLNSHEMEMSEKGRLWHHHWFQALPGKKTPHLAICKMDLAKVLALCKMNTVWFGDREFIVPVILESP